MMKTSSIPTALRALPTLTLPLLLSLAACGGGGGAEPVPPSPPAAKLTNKNFLDAYAVSAVAAERLVVLQAARALALPLVGEADGSLPCPKGGTLTLVRNGAERRFMAANCGLESVLLVSGSFSLSFEADPFNGEYQARDLSYRLSGDTVSETVNAKVSTKSSAAAYDESGAISVLRGAKTDSYSGYRLVGSPAADTSKISLNLQAARFELALSLNIDEKSLVNITADDQSSVTMGVAADGRARFELRAVGNPGIETIYPSEGEMGEAMARARQ